MITLVIPSIRCQPWISTVETGALAAIVPDEALAVEEGRRQIRLSYGMLRAGSAAGQLEETACKLICGLPGADIHALLAPQRHSSVSGMALYGPARPERLPIGPAPAAPVLRALDINARMLTRTKNKRANARGALASIRVPYIFVFLRSQSRIFRVSRGRLSRMCTRASVCVVHTSEERSPEASTLARPKRQG